MKNVFEKQKELLIESFNDFLDQKNRIEKMGYPFTIYIEKIKLLNNVNKDFFVLQNVQGGVNYIVSQKLKLEIENEDCTGIEFKPIELSTNEWLPPSTEREKIYGKV